MKYTENSIIGQIVAEDYRTAAVFKSFEIDFCCQGNRTIKDASLKRGLDVNAIIIKLNDLKLVGQNSNIDFQSWPVDLLADYIEKVHHRYIKEKGPILVQFLEKIKKVHGENHPELIKVHSLFLDSYNELLHHMMKEEKIIFPYTRQIAQDDTNYKETEIQNPINVMMQEHETEGERFREISAITNKYTPPSDACTTYKVAFDMLREFEENLHKHIHLENNILFPKVLEVEASVFQMPIAIEN